MYVNGYVYVATHLETKSDAGINGSIQNRYIVRGKMVKAFYNKPITLISYTWCSWKLFLFTNIFFTEKLHLALNLLLQSHPSSHLKSTYLSYFLRNMALSSKETEGKEYEHKIASFV